MILVLSLSGTHGGYQINPLVLIVGWHLVVHTFNNGAKTRLETYIDLSFDFVTGWDKSKRYIAQMRALPISLW